MHSAATWTVILSWCSFVSNLITSLDPRKMIIQENKMYMTALFLMKTKFSRVHLFLIDPRIFHNWCAQLHLTIDFQFQLIAKFACRRTDLSWTMWLTGSTHRCCDPSISRVFWSVPQWAPSPSHLSHSTNQSQYTTRSETRTFSSFARIVSVMIIFLEERNSTMCMMCREIWTSLIIREKVIKVVLKCIHQRNLDQK